jgi:hypothetical protein
MWLTRTAVALAVVGLPWTGWAADAPKAAPGAAHEAHTQGNETPVAGPQGYGMAGGMPCPMMAGMAHGPGMAGPRGMGMMGMPAPGPTAGPKERGRWMQMRGEMMRAMGDIMLRYGRELEAAR